MLLKGEDGYYCTILPEERDLVTRFQGYTVRQIEAQLLSEYNSKEPDVITIENPLVRISDNRTSLYKIERSGNELRIFTSILQGPDLWISYDANTVIVASGKTYKCKEIIGMAGCERDIFWSPDYCIFRFCHVYEPLDEDVKEIDINPDSEDDQWFGVQVYPGYNPYEDCLKLEIPYTYVMLHNVDSDSQRDLLYLSAVEYNKDNTMLYFNLALMEPRHVPIFIGDDLTITTKSGSVYNIQRLHGIPLNENFIRHAGYTTSPFRAEFPAITDEIDIVSGTVCGEFLTINGNRESVNTVSE